ncbi:BEN domain-containing protein 7 [Varanus komodoensis]|nr:BEN domain-containing protein 7 [Varanus komodoensis]
MTAHLNMLNATLQGKGCTALHMLGEVLAFIETEKQRKSEGTSGTSRLCSRHAHHVHVQPILEHPHRWDLNDLSWKPIPHPRGVSQPNLEMELAGIADKDIWVSKFKCLTTNLKDVAHQKPILAQNHKWSDIGNLPKPNKLVFETWNDIPDTYMNMKMYAFGVLSIFGSTYVSEQVFSNVNYIKNKLCSHLTDDSLQSCVKMKVTSYSPDVQTLYTEKNVKQSGKEHQRSRPSPPTPSAAITPPPQHNCDHARHPSTLGRRTIYQRVGKEGEKLKEEPQDLDLAWDQRLNPPAETQTNLHPSQSGTWNELSPQSSHYSGQYGTRSKTFQNQARAISSNGEIPTTNSSSGSNCCTCNCQPALQAILQELKTMRKIMQIQAVAAQNRQQPPVPLVCAQKSTMSRKRNKKKKNSPKTIESLTVNRKLSTAENEKKLPASSERSSTEVTESSLKLEPQVSGFGIVLESSSSDPEVQLAEGFDVFMPKSQLDSILANYTRSGSLLFRKLVCAFFDDKTLANSLPNGKRKRGLNDNRKGLDQNIVGAIKVCTTDSIQSFFVLCLNVWRLVILVKNVSGISMPYRVNDFQYVFTEKYCTANHVDKLPGPRDWVQILQDQIKLARRRLKRGSASLEEEEVGNQQPEHS